MRSILRATAVLGSSSVVTILVGLASAKAWAILLGPDGVGYLGLLQSLIGVAVLIGGLGVGTGLVREVASLLAASRLDAVAAFRRAAWLLMWLLAALTFLVLVLFRGPISQLMLGQPHHGFEVGWLGVAVLGSLMAGLQISTLNSFHRVDALARVAILNSVLGFVVTLFAVWRWREAGIVPGMIGAAIGSWIVCTYFLRREVGPVAVRPARRDVYRAARSLLHFGVPYTASMLVGTGVQLMLPVLVLHVLDRESVGFYRAAVAISVNYMGFLLTAMAQDYYPRISAVSNDPAELGRLVNEQHWLIMLLATPLILGILALTPHLVPLIYSRQFTPATSILEWQLVGNLLKFSSWTMSFVILARSGSRTFFAVELIAGVASIVGSWLGMRWFGLAGLGIGFCITYVVYYTVVWLIVRREIGLVWALPNQLLLLFALSAALFVRGLPLVGLEPLKLPVGLSLALLTGVGSMVMIWREIGGVRGVRAGG